jgi:hypothetical protein
MNTKTEEKRRTKAPLFFKCAHKQNTKNLGCAALYQDRKRDLQRPSLAPKHEQQWNKLLSRSVRIGTEDNVRDELVCHETWAQIPPNEKGRKKKGESIFISCLKPQSLRPTDEDVRPSLALSLSLSLSFSPSTDRRREVDWTEKMALDERSASLLRDRERNCKYKKNPNPCQNCCYLVVPTFS